SARADDGGGGHRWFDAFYSEALHSPLPATVNKSPGIIPATIPPDDSYPDPSGSMGIHNNAGTTTTANNAFFQSLGTNGRSCGTCHLPSNGMSVSAANIRQRFKDTKATDPIFAPFDGATCPDAVPESFTKGSPVGGNKGKGNISDITNLSDPNNPFRLVVNKGLIRIPLPRPANAEFTLTVVNDVTKCQDKQVDVNGTPTPMISFYRRPLMSSNLLFATNAAISFTGGPALAPVMWDGRETSSSPDAALRQQAIDATFGHAQATPPGPTDAQVQQIMDFEKSVFSAQISDDDARSLTDLGALGGPKNLALRPLQANFVPPGVPGQTFDEYTSWLNLSNNAEKKNQRASVARGQGIFNTLTFTVNGVAGFNELVGNNAQTQCSVCHGIRNAGTDPIAVPFATRNLGISGDHPAAFARPDLPLFHVSCIDGAPTTFNGKDFDIRDLGQGLITGKCADIGKFKVPQLRGLAGRAPYFHDGSADTLDDVVTFYDRRFSIGLTKDQTRDLVNFLKTL
ncbi:MAG: hypothetical protein ACJ73N_03750, partial [Bryobacteraceae bacterium]